MLSYNYSSKYKQIVRFIRKGRDNEKKQFIFNISAIYACMTCMYTYFTHLPSFMFLGVKVHVCYFMRSGFIV